MLTFSSKNYEKICKHFFHASKNSLTKLLLIMMDYNIWKPLFKLNIFYQMRQKHFQNDLEIIFLMVGYSLVLMTFFLSWDHAIAISLTIQINWAKNDTQKRPKND